MKPLRAAVVGAGYLGAHHARKYMMCEDSVLTAVVDIDTGRAERVALETGARRYSDFRQLIGQVDIASVVVPTSAHFEVASHLLKAGIHVLVEKPIAATVAQARKIVELAKAHQCVLQVGHLERFNPVVQALLSRVGQPMFISSDRIAPFNLRGTDVDVVLDLMIHDIDLVLSLVDSPVRRIDASGSPVLSSHLDIANARIQFDSGCVATLTASRVSHKRERSIRIFQHNAYFSANLCTPTLDVYRKSDREMYPGIAAIECERVQPGPGDALKTEIEAFVASVRTGSPPQVSGNDGLRALETANAIIRQLEAQPLPGQPQRGSLAS